MMLFCPWISYLIAEGLELSGIVAILTNGVVLKIYANPNISSGSKKVLSLGYETFAYTFETIVFLFLGIGLTAFNHPFKQMGWGLCLTTVLNLNLARGINVLICSWLANMSRKTHRLNAKTQFVMWISGLRGAMAYALALKAAVDLPMGPVILIDTLIYAFITILLIGSILNPLLSKMDVKRKEGEEAQVEEDDSNKKCICCVKCKRGVAEFDREHFSPLFIKDPEINR